MRKAGIPARRDRQPDVKCGFGLVVGKGGTEPGIYGSAREGFLPGEVILIYRRTGGCSIRRMLP